MDSILLHPGEKSGINRASPVIEDRYLTFEGADSAIYIKSFPHLDVINDRLEVAKLSHPSIIHVGKCG